MTSQVATHKDTGIVTESELAQRKRDVRGRSAGWSPDADKGFDLSETGDDKTELPTTEKKFAIVELVEKFIRKKGSQFCVVSHSGKNLGCSPSRGGAEKRLAQVEYWKHKKSLTEDLVVKSLDAGELTVMDDELAKFVAYQNYVYAKLLFAKHLPGKHDQADHAGENARQTVRGEPGTKEGDIFDQFLSHADSSGLKLLAKQMGISTTGRHGHEMTERELRSEFRSIAKKMPGKVLRWLEDANLLEKHLPNQHDQQSHAGAGGAAGKVSHTPAQIRDAAARQFAKDEGVSIAQAKKKVTSGAHVPTTKIPKKANEYEGMDEADIALKKKELKISINAYKERRHYDRTAEQESKDERWLRSMQRELADIEAHTKSLIVKADQACLKSIWEQSYKYYTGKWIAAAQQFVLKKDWGRAAAAMAKARDGYQEEKNPKEWGCLDAWRQFYQDKVEGGK